jgi:hypothetical protein
MMIPVLEKPVKTKTVSPLNSSELEQRVAILKRFRELLSQQRDRFRQYLVILDKQKDVIEAGNAEDLISHVELEEKVVGDIFAIQKVIDPLEALYQASGLLPVVPGNLQREMPVSSAGQEVPSLRAALEELKAEAISRSDRNRQLLARRMAALRQEMKTLRANPYAIHRSAFSNESASLVDIKG